MDIFLTFAQNGIPGGQVVVIHVTVVGVAVYKTFTTAVATPVTMLPPMMDVGLRPN